MSGTTNIYLHDLAKKICPSKYVGIYACDELSMINTRLFTTKPSTALIVNLIASSAAHIHGHWVSINVKYKKRKKQFSATYFDPLGHDSTFDTNIKHFLYTILKCTKVVSNPYPIQHPRSQFCGFYTIAHVISVETNLPFTDFLNIFHHAPTFYNDKVVIKFICNYIKN